jgi:hypothetical protein
VIGNAIAFDAANEPPRHGVVQDTKIDSITADAHLRLKT